MRTVVATLAAVLLIAILGGVGFVYSGLYNVAATEPHWGLTYRLLNIVRVRSIKAHAAGIAVPAGLDDPAKIVTGTDHFADHCAVCHGAPGVPRGEIAEGLYPQPPNLGKAAKRYSPAELFWIVKNGFKMTGMPSWDQHSDEELWATVAFLEKLPGMTKADYARLVKMSIEAGGHHHGGEDTPGTGGMPPHPADHGGAPH